MCAYIVPEFEGDMELNCSSVRLGNGPLLLTVNWSTKKTEEAIGYFTLNIKNEKEIKIKANVSNANTPTHAHTDSLYCLP